MSQQEVSVFDFDEGEGLITNRRRVFHIPETQGNGDATALAFLEAVARVREALDSLISNSLT